MAVVISGDTGITSVNGTATAPSITGADTNTGIVYGTDTLSLATGGVAAVTVDSSQNVGIGTSSLTSVANYKTLNINGTTGGIVYLQSNGTNVLQLSGDASSIGVAGLTNIPMLFSTNNTERMRIDSSGNVGIGTSSPTATLTVKAQAGMGAPLVLESTDAGGNPQVAFSGTRLFQIGTGNASSGFTNSLFFYDGTAGATRMSIDSSGNLAFNSGYGSAATAYGCRAWVNFNGTGTVAIRGSGNVSSITDRGVGLYTVNFTNAMPDENYSAVATCKPVAAAGSIVYGCLAYYSTATNPTLTGSVAVDTRAGTAGVIDSPYVCVSVFR